MNTHGDERHITPARPNPGVIGSRKGSATSYELSLGKVSTSGHRVHRWVPSEHPASRQQSMVSASLTPRREDHDSEEFEGSEDEDLNEETFGSNALNPMAYNADFGNFTNMGTIPPRWQRSTLNADCTVLAGYEFYGPIPPSSSHQESIVWDRLSGTAAHGASGLTLNSNSNNIFTPLPTAPYAQTSFSSSLFSHPPTLPSSHSASPPHPSSPTLPRSHQGAQSLPISIRSSSASSSSSQPSSLSSSPSAYDQQYGQPPLSSFFSMSSGGSPHSSLSSFFSFSPPSPSLVQEAGGQPTPSYDLFAPSPESHPLGLLNRRIGGYNNLPFSSHTSSYAPHHPHSHHPLPHQHSHHPSTLHHPLSTSLGQIPALPSSLGSSSSHQVQGTRKRQDSYESYFATFEPPALASMMGTGLSGHHQSIAESDEMMLMMQQDESLDDFSDSMTLSGDSNLEFSGEIDQLAAFHERHTSHADSKEEEEQGLEDEEEDPATLML